MKINELRKYFYDSNEFVIRLRKDKDIVYYNGIRAMNIIHLKGKNKDEIYELIPSVYCLNKAFLISKEVKKNLQDHNYEDVISSFLKMRDNLRKKDQLLDFKKSPKIIITRENHENKSSLKDENRVVLELLQELEKYGLSPYLKFNLVKEYTLEDLSNITYEKIEKIKQELCELFSLNCQILCTKIHWKRLKKEKKNFKAKIKQRTLDKDYYEQLKQTQSLDLVKVQFKFEKKTPIQTFKDTYISLTDFNLNYKANKLFENSFKTLNNYSFKDTIEIDIKMNTDFSMKKMLLIELFVLKHWILDEDCNYIDTNKIHRKKPDIKILQCPQKLVEDLTLKQLETIVSKIKDGIEYYESFKYESEKNYQHQFMLDEKVPDKLKDALNLESSHFLYPFEEEYYTTDAENEEDDEDEDDNEDKDTENAKLGRIDNVFLDIHKDQSIDVYLIELKYNESALGGTNGLHTHLNDIKKLFNADYHKFEKTLNKVINNHLKIVHDIKPNTKLPTSIHKICGYHFLIIIGYEKEKKTLIKEILNTYNQEEYYKNLKDEKYNNIPFPKINRSKFYKTTLREIYEKIPCDVKLFLDEVHKDKKKNKVQITNKPLEKHDL